MNKSAFYLFYFTEFIFYFVTLQDYVLKAYAYWLC